MEFTKLRPIKHQNYAVLSLSFKQQMSKLFRCMHNVRIVTCMFILVIVVTVYALWPSGAHVDDMCVTLGHVRVHSSPHPAIDVALNATVEVNNMATMYTLDYTSVHMAVMYRGKELGHVIARGAGHVRDSGSSYVDANVEFEGAEVDSVYLLDDYAKGVIQLDTVAQLDGFVSLLFQVPLKAKYLCKIDVDIANQTIFHQTCQPKAMEIGFSFSFPIPFIPLGQVNVQIALRF